MFWLLKSKKNKLFDALYTKDCSLSLKILKRHKNLINAIDDDENTTLALASEAGCLDVVKFLFEHGIKSVNFKRKDGVSALELAVKGNYFKIVNILLEYGADVNVKDINGESIFHWVNYKSNLQIAKALLDYGANINAKDNNNMTPLHWAAKCKNEEFVKFLLYNNADTGIRDSELKFAVDYADEDIKKLFQNKGYADV